MIQYLLPQRIVEDREECVEILMQVWRVLDVKHKLKNLVLNFLWKFHLSHCAVNEIQLLIKMG